MSFDPEKVETFDGFRHTPDDPNPEDSLGLWRGEFVYADDYRQLLQLYRELLKFKQRERHEAINRMTQEAVEAGLYDKVLLPEDED